MRADNTMHLITAAKQRHELTRAKTIRALHELDKASAPVNFQTVAQQAGVSRSWLYTQPDIKNEIDRLRTLANRASATPLPAQQRTSDTSLLRRLELAHHRNHQLAEDNQQLRRQLAHALGQLRAVGLPLPAEPATKAAPARRCSVTIGPC
jgi:hypothetical protein